MSSENRIPVYVLICGVEHNPDERSIFLLSNDPEHKAFLFLPASFDVEVFRARNFSFQDELRYLAIFGDLTEQDMICFGFINVKKSFLLVGGFCDQERSFWWLLTCSM